MYPIAPGQHLECVRAVSQPEVSDEETPVATAKVRIPVGTPTTLVRERLNVLLDSAVTGTTAGPSVTVVCAPAGSGKTTALATWARRQVERGEAAVAWVSLDSEDNDPV